MKLIDIHISNDKVFSTLNCNSKVVVVIGNFDGLHKGHQKLLKIAKKEAANLKLPFGIVTFDPHPRVFFSKSKSNFLLTDSLEPTNEWYAIAKISGVKLCEAIRRQFGKDFVCLMPSNLYGSNDNFDLQTSHVLPSMIRKFHEAKENNHSDVILWGSGSPMREFLHVDDLANAVVFALENILPNYIYNVGTGTDVTIKKLAETIQSQVGHKGNINWDSSKPDGTPRKLMDSSKMMQLGWRPTYNLKKGIANTYSWFLENQAHLKEVKFEVK